MISNRKQRLEELEKFISMKRVDLEVLDILKLINSDPRYLTTSSCSGRLQLLEFETIGDKKGSLVISRWHQTPSRETFLNEVMHWRGEGNLYLMVQSPIFHVEAKDIESAVTLRNLAQAEGFKYSTIRSIKLDRLSRKPVKIVVEILGSERLHVPLGFRSNLLVSTQYLEFLHGRVAHHMGRAKSSLRKFEKSLKKGR